MATARPMPLSPPVMTARLPASRPLPRYDRSPWSGVGSISDVTPGGFCCCEGWGTMHATSQFVSRPNLQWPRVAIRQHAPVRLITWNVAGRVARQPEQAAAIAGIEADVVALQEVTARTLPLWRSALAASGFPRCECSLDGAAVAAGRRVLGVLTAAREPLRRLASPPDVPWPERVLCCAVAG